MVVSEYKYPAAVVSSLMPHAACRIWLTWYVVCRMPLCRMPYLPYAVSALCRICLYALCRICLMPYAVSCLVPCAVCSMPYAVLEYARMPTPHTVCTSYRTGTVPPNMPYSHSYLVQLYCMLQAASMRAKDIPNRTPEDGITV